MLNLYTFGLGLGLLTAGTVYHAYRLHQQFFPACVHLLRSSLSLVVSAGQWARRLSV